MDAVVHKTLTFKQAVQAPLARVWEAFAKPVQRAAWSVPSGEALVYEQANFRIGGQDIYRCGPPQSLDFHGTARYHQIAPMSLIVHTDAVTTAGQALSIALVTWQFTALGDETQILLTDQVVSFVGPALIDGHANGHAKALEQLRVYLEPSSGKF